MIDDLDRRLIELFLNEPRVGVLEASRGSALLAARSRHG